METLPTTDKRHRTSDVFHPVRSRRTFEEAIEQIAFAIRVGDLHVGDRLPAERTLAGIMGISRPALREAIKVLAKAGVVTVLPGSGGGTVVKSDTIPTSLVHRGIELRIGEVAAVLEARRLIEPQIAQLAGLYASDADFRALQQAIDSHRQAMQDADLRGQWDERFHLLIARATGNPTLVDVMRGLLRKLAIAWDMDYRGRDEPERGLVIHERTLRALMSRDPAQINEVMDEHLAILERQWEDETGRPRLRRALLNPDVLLGPKTLEPAQPLDAHS
jgi:GntR family transcriptional repressor for pyruvate dehydrogenase complex